MNRQWILLAISTALFLPPAVALAAGWAPRRLRHRVEPVRALGWSLVAVYLAAPLNAVPRAVGADPATVLVCTAAALPCALAGLAVLLVATRRRESRRCDAAGGGV